MHTAMTARRTEWSTPPSLKGTLSSTVALAPAPDEIQSCVGAAIGSRVLLLLWTNNSAASPGCLAISGT
jgi:hypothetical protein